MTAAISKVPSRTSAIARKLVTSSFCGWTHTHTHIYTHIHTTHAARTHNTCNTHTRTDRYTCLRLSTRAGTVSLCVESLKEFISLQQSDSKCQKIVSRLTETPELPFTVDPDGALYHVQVGTDMDKKYRSHRRLVVPQSLKAFVLRQAHGMIHMGSKRTSHIITGRYYWDGIVADILQWCSSCLVCRKRKTCRPLNAGIPKTMSCDRPFQRVSLDLIGKFPKSGTYQYALTMIDVFTRFTLVVPIEDKYPHTIAKAIFKKLISVFGIPQSILTDQGGEFVNQGLNSMCRTFGISKIHSAARNSRGNSYVERFHRFCNSSMYALQISHGAKWGDFIDAVTFCYNITAHASTGLSPYYLLFGRHPSFPTDAVCGFSLESEFDIQENYHIHVAKEMKVAYDYVRHRQLDAAEKNRRTREASATLVEYQVGQPVLLWQPQQPAYTFLDGDFTEISESPAKWTPRWTGPHTVSKKCGPNNYDVVHGRTGTIFERCNVNALVPWEPWSESISSTSDPLDRPTPWSFTGIPQQDTLIAVATGETTYGIGKVLRTPGSISELIDFQWISNDKDDYSKPIHLAWIPKPRALPDGRDDIKNIDHNAVVHQAERPSGFVAYTASLSATDAPSEHLLLNGFELNAKSGTIPASVKWAVMEARKLYF